MGSILYFGYWHSLPYRSTEAPSFVVESDFGVTFFNRTSCGAKLGKKETKNKPLEAEDGARPTSTRLPVRWNVRSWSTLTSRRPFPDAHLHVRSSFAYRLRMQIRCPARSRTTPANFLGQAILGCLRIPSDSSIAESLIPPTSVQESALKDSRRSLRIPLERIFEDSSNHPSSPRRIVEHVVFFSSNDAGREPCCAR